MLNNLIEPVLKSPRYPKDLNYLDLGSGIGLLVWAARKAGMKAYGIDIDPLAVEYGMNTLGLNLSVCNFETDVLPWNHKFDIITMTHVLEHIISPAAALARLYDLLNPSGLLTIEVPNIYSRSAQSNFLDWEYNSGEVHLHFYSIQSLQQLLLNAGFAIEHTLTKCNCGERWLSGDCLVVFARKIDYPDTERNNG